MLDKFKPRLTSLPDGASLRQPAVMLATWFGAGLCRPAPGTIGTLAALPAGYLIAWLGGLPLLIAAALLLCIAGTYAAGIYGKMSGETDDQSIVVDEAAGLWIAALPAATDPLLWLVAFLLFRAFDIYKPWPASYFDRKKRGGLDVMMDDVVAGLYALPGVATLAYFNAMQV